MTDLLADRVYADIAGGLRRIGYSGSLLEEDYRFSDWFVPHVEERQIAAAAFGQTPVSYESACIGVCVANGFSSQELVNRYRALGAPIILELDREEIREWAVSRVPNKHGLVERYSVNQIDQMFESRAADWKPEPLLRAKNIGSFQWSEQLGLFTGLLPELEQHIREKLDPLLRTVLASAVDAYSHETGRNPDPAKLFKLVFWILTAKVFQDRRISEFASLGRSADELLYAVAQQYKVELPQLLTRQARQVVVDGIWDSVDFRNLSVEVLSQIWSATLVDDRTKQRLGIHRTPGTIVRYMLERIPFEQSGDSDLIILEPCSGSAGFLIGAMNVLRKNLFGMSPVERHKYFSCHLAGLEKDPFAVEISRLALTLADFPNPDGWDIVQRDIFEPGALTGHLQRAGVVLCNPPFGDFNKDEKEYYQPSSTKKPVELLQKVLADLHPRGVIGFVLPRNIIDGRGYAGIRKSLAERFETLELTVLPDRAFDDADSETGLLIATNPIPHGNCRITNRKVQDDADAWRDFELGHKVTSEYVLEFGIEEAEQSIGVPELPEVWDFLSNYPTLGDVAEMHRGIQWKQSLTENGKETGNRSRLVREDPRAGFSIGIAPKTKFDVFERPKMRYLSMKPGDQEGKASKHDWDKPKAILNKAARSRGPWRIAAFPDAEGVTCYQTYIGVWPTEEAADEYLLAAILNSPVANAFVATREGKTDITVETLRLIPVPNLAEAKRSRLRNLIKRYQEMKPLVLDAGRTGDGAAHLLKQIDALVLDGYHMPPELERQLLEFFRGARRRPTWHSFSNYFPEKFTPNFSLSDYISPEFESATSGELVKRVTSL